MTTANTTTSTIGCGTPTLVAPIGSVSYTSGAASIAFSDGTIAPGATCTIKVNVTAPTASATTYDNTTGHLYINSTTDTGNTASAKLTVGDTPAPPIPPATCSNPTQLAIWDFSNYSASTTTNNGPFNASSQTSGLTNVQATFGSGGTSASGIANNTTYPTGWNAPDAQTPTDNTSWGIKGGWPATNVVPTGSTTPYFQFAAGSVDKFGSIAITTRYNMVGNWSNGDNWYILFSTDNSTWSRVANSPWNKSNGWKTGVAAIQADTGSSAISNVYFRIILAGQQSDTAVAYLDDVKITGCLRPDPPTVTKSFSPDPIAVVDGTSALTLTITNPNASGQTIYGVAISDYLPWSDLQGTVSVNSGNTAVTGVGTAFTTQLKANSIVAIPSTLVSLPNTVSATNGSTTVTTSSGFTSNLAAGSIISIASVNYTVASVASDTSLTLARAYRGSTASGLTASTYKTYTVASITDNTHMTLVSSAASTLSSVKMSAGLTLSAAPITTCGSPVIGFSGYPAISLTGGNLSGTLATTNGSATVTGTGTAFQNELGAGRILLLPYQLTGTVSVTSGSNIVTGNTAGNPKAAFLTEISMGQRITINSVDYIVSHVTSDSQLELTTSYAGATASGLSATSYREYTVSSIASNTSLTLSTTYASAVNLSGLTVKASWPEAVPPAPSQPPSKPTRLEYAKM